MSYFFQLKIVLFAAVRNRRILQRRVIVMESKFKDESVVILIVHTNNLCVLVATCTYRMRTKEAPISLRIGVVISVPPLVAAE